MSNTTNEFAGLIIGGCELIRELGRGNNGIVYLAKQVGLHRQAACKIIHKDLRDDQEYLDNLLEEATNAAKLSHQNVIQALDAGIDEKSGIGYFIMEYVDGFPLEHIRTAMPEMISMEFMLHISMQIAGAMNFAWTEHKMVHGDIKPGNIMISRREHIVKIGDLGLARSSNGMTGKSDDIMVTPLYAAPEVIAQVSTNADPRSDIYSFGVMLYELACGAPPFTGSMDEILVGHLSGTPQPLLVMNPDLDREFAEFIDSMLSKDPDDRPADWKSVKAKLQEIYKRLFPGSRPPELGQDNHAAAVTIQNTVKHNYSSWSAEEKNKKRLLEKFPWIMPVVLIVLILIALISIPFTLGLFK